jgi:Trypsin-like peptidase domain
VAVPDTNTIVAAVRATRAEFGDAFLRAQAGVRVENRRPFEGVAAVAPAGDERAAFREAVHFAEQGGWVADLVDELIASDLETGALRTARVREVKGDAFLQAITDVDRGLANPQPLVRGLTNGMTWTGKIVIEGEARGTGVLVKPHLVLTAWHVVKDLFRQSNGQWQADPAAGPKLQVVFDDLLVRRRSSLVARPPLQVAAHADWCPLFGPCHSAELNHSFPDDLVQLEGYWDFALIRLAVAVGLDRGHAVCNPLVTVPRPGGTVYVFQHPNGAPQRVDNHQVFPPDEKLRTAVPRLRFLHTANANPGSSGGPCFDRDFMLCGLHQGEWKKDDAQRVVNRGIPLARIWEYVSSQPAGLPLLDPQDCLIASLGPGGADAPVIGCDTFLGHLWATALTGRASVLVIDGAEKSGKSFRLRVADAVLAESNHLKVPINAPQLTALSAEEFAARLCRLAGGELPQLLPREEAETTAAAWLKGELVPKVVAALNDARRGRLVWLMITDLNRCDAYGSFTSEFLYLLYEQVLTNDWLRVVLDGMKGDIPATLRQVTIRHDVPAVTEAEIRTYLQRRLTELGVTGIDSQALAAAVPLLHQIYLITNRDVAIRGLASAAQDVVHRIAAGD